MQAIFAYNYLDNRGDRHNRTQNICEGIYFRQIIRFFLSLLGLNIAIFRSFKG